MPISPGDNVGPYRIIELLGQGGMAPVFKAYHPALYPNLSTEIECVLLKPLAKDPSARYASATELMAAREQAAGIDAAHVAMMSPPLSPVTQVVPTLSSVPGRYRLDTQWQT